MTDVKEGEKDYQLEEPISLGQCCEIKLSLIYIQVASNITI